MHDTQKKQGGKMSDVVGGTIKTALENEAICNELAKLTDEIASPAAKQLGEGLGDLCYILLSPLKFGRAAVEQKLISFIEKIKQKAESIPMENLQSPPARFIGPVLEDTIKGYNDEEYLREMFANLIASSMDKTKSVHPRFLHIVSQLSRDDALFLKKIKNYNSYFPLSVSARVEDSAYQEDWKVFSMYPPSSINKQMLLTLESLGLLKVAVYNTALRKQRLSKHTFDNINPQERVFLSASTQLRIRLSELGVDFARVCIS